MPLVAHLALVLVVGAGPAAAPLDLELVGVVVSRRAEQSVVLLRSAGRSRTAAVGEVAFGGRVLSVSREGAALDFAGQKLDLRLATRVASLPPAAPPPPSTRESRPGDGGLTFDRKDVEQRLGVEMPRILAETAVVPVMVDGRVAGLSVSRMPQGSLLSDAGLQPGDVITQINDTVIDGMATLIGLWPRLQSASDLHAVVLRNGQPVSLRVKLR
jgi:type II secretion system protein C